MTTLALLLSAVGTASASKQIYNYFGTPSGFGSSGGEFTFPQGVAVNNTGAGPAEAGEVYVVDGGFEISGFANRIERFSRDAEGEFHFVSAWGAGVQSGGSDYEVCTAAASCHAATASGGNGTPAGNGALNKPTGIAVDQDTGQVYVLDSGNSRVNVYAGDGTFLRSFGFDVAASGPGSIAGPEEEQRLLVKADSGKFSIAFRGRATGPRGTGSRQQNLKAIGSVTTTEGTFAVGQSISGQAIPPNTTITKIGAGEVTMSKSATGSTDSAAPLFGDDLAFNAGATEVEAALNALPSVSPGGSISVTRTELAADEFEYTLRFGGTLAGEDVPAIVPTHEGLGLGAGIGSATVSTVADSGSLETCQASAGDICKAGDAGSQLGQIGPLGMAIAVSQPDGDPDSGRVFIADAGEGPGTGNERIDAYDFNGSSPFNFGTGVFKGRDARNGKAPLRIAVDSRGIVYAANDEKIERYDSEGVNGSVGFLAPIPGATEEVQQVTVSASSGQFRLSFEGESTGDLAFNVPASGGTGPTASVRNALEALPAIGSAPEGAPVFVTGGPGDAGGTNPYVVRFSAGGKFAGVNVEQLTAIDGTVPLSGGSGATITTEIEGEFGLPASVGKAALSVQPDPDGPGPGSDVLFLAPAQGGSISGVYQMGPVNAPGLNTPPAAFDDVHGTTSQFESGSSGGLGIDEASGDLYLTGTEANGEVAHGVYVLGEIGPPPSASLDSVDEVTATSARVHGTVDPNGPPKVGYQVEYSLDGSTWQSSGSILVGHQETPQAVSTVLDPAPTGLEPKTLYHVRLRVTKPGSDPVVTSELTFTTLPAPPQIETTGSPVRTTTTALLSGRVGPRNSETSYHFEYGTQGPCGANPCQSTEVHSAGAGEEMKLVAERVEGLQPNTTYHYRLVGENESPESPSSGADMTVRTRASDAPLGHGHLPGAPGSDRGYEQVTMPDTGGNPLLGSLGFSSNGNRALYRIFGGTPISDSGTFFGLYFAERTASGWQTRRINPPRDELVGPDWSQPISATTDLSTILGINRDGVITGDTAFWSLDPSAPPQKLFEPTVAQEPGGELLGYGLAADGSRPVAVLQGGELDPTHPEAAAARNVYDVGSTPPRLLDLMPGNTAPACGVFISSGTPFNVPRQSTHWVSGDGSKLFFPSRGDDCSSQPQLYEREIETGQTKLISGPRVSGPICGAGLLKATQSDVFFWTQSRLAEEDTAVENCGGSAGGDVYRYSLEDETLECVTCVVGVSADVNVPSGGIPSVAIAEDGSRVYFSTETHLLPGVPPTGQVASYRVDVASGELAYVAPARVGERVETSTAISANGSVLLFRSNSSALNPIGGLRNGGTEQYYLYDDRDRSLVCASCPQDGSAPANEVQAGISSPFDSPELSLTPLSADGRTFAFATPNALLGPDQNTAGPGQEPIAGRDAYEWRDGRLLLVSDGLTNWFADSGPQIEGVSPSGRDIYFSAATQYTQDALDGYKRLYDARIGGGFEFPKPPPPCPLEVCQGTPKGAPEEQEPASTNFAGNGNKAPAAHKKKHKKAHKKKHRKAQKKKHRKAQKKRAHKKKKAHHKRARHRAGHNGRSGR
ncbi:MAG TPA: hypothetical protein VG898_10955 [Solirubrobacterales bacterium]|nr:hypothetical protein [Solirubrobacterales bacterium]